MDGVDMDHIMDLDYMDHITEDIGDKNPYFYNHIYHIGESASSN